MWAYNKGCDGDVWACSEDSENLENSPHFVDELVKNLNVAQNIYENNYASVCKGYDNLPVSRKLNNPNLNRNSNSEDMCTNDRGIGSDIYAFITADGMLFNFSTDFGVGNGGFVDINGPDKAPNVFGRDIFIFYLRKSLSNGDKAIEWGGTTKLDTSNTCGEPNSDEEASDCAAKLLQEGKMNY